MNKSQFYRIARKVDNTGIMDTAAASKHEDMHQKLKQSDAL